MEIREYEYVCYAHYLCSWIYLDPKYVMSLYVFIFLVINAIC